MHVQIHNRILLSNKENPVICRKMDRSGDQHVKLNKPDSERQVSHVESRKKKKKDDLNIEH
jgi:hypothetical protein